MLKNTGNVREPPSITAIGEQIPRSRSKLSGAKKRQPKKNAEGLEYFTVATSNKLYEGYKEEVRGDPEEGKRKEDAISDADPAYGGYTINYFMEGGPRYEVDSIVASKSFGMLLLLIFT